MTRKEYRDINGWFDLQDAMRSHEYYDELDGDLYEYESDLVDGFEWAVRNECREIADIQRMDIQQIDYNAEAWCVSPDFSYVTNYYSDDFNDLKEDFYEWLEDNELFDDEEDPEMDECEDEREVFDGNLELVLFGA